MKCFIYNTNKRLVTEDVFVEQSQWEILKSEIRKFSIRYSKVIVKEKRKKQHELESKLKILEKSLSCDKNIEEYHKCKADLDEIYDNIAEGVKLGAGVSGMKKMKNQQSISLISKKSRQKNVLYKDLVKYNEISNEIFSYFKSHLKKRIKLIN